MTAGGRPAPGLRAELAPGKRGLLRADLQQLERGLWPDPQRGQAARLGDAGVLDEDRRGAARRNIADRSVNRLAVGRLWPARHVTRVDRTVRGDGLRRRAAQEGVGNPPGARRATRLG